MAATVSFHLTINLCLQNLLRRPNNSTLVFLDKLGNIRGRSTVRTFTNSGSLSAFLPRHCKFDMVGLLLHLSGCAIIDHFISSRN